MVGIYRHIAKYIHLHSTRCSFMSWDYVQTYENAISPVCRFGFPVLCVSSFHDQHSCWRPLLCWWHLHMVCRCISLSLDSQVLLSVHWLARARDSRTMGSMGQNRGGICGLWACHGLRIGKPMPSHCFSFLICFVHFWAYLRNLRQKPSHGTDHILSTLPPRAMRLIYQSIFTS